MLASYHSLQPFEAESYEMGWREDHRTAQGLLMSEKWKEKNWQNGNYLELYCL